MGRVLVVDDEPDVLLLCRLNLQQRGHEVLEASEGKRALELARERHPDVIVLDLMLPGMTGYDVLETLQARRAARRTSRSSSSRRSPCAPIGSAPTGWAPQAFLTKPFLPSELCELVDSLGPSWTREAEGPELGSGRRPA